MNEPSQSAEELFDCVLQLPTEERSAFLTEACGNHSTLRERVEALLLAHEQQSQFLPEESESDVLDLAALESPGTQIDHYKLLEKLGEGGFGAVWAAEQRTPVRRRVALKIIKLGMDTKQVVARFEAERQALALMDHPNIAKVLDAGATANGRPYFVMELVKGISLIKYCDQEKLDPNARLGLFIQVCNAIQHAHQKGVIHRDIKPSNIMVTLHDGVPVPRVIDFGIAKATHQALTDKTIYTQYSQFIGTPAYMSPEQAEMSGLDIDTRCDIYSLGVLLYELLAGQTPFESSELAESGLEEMRRIIREREPQRPSTKVGTLEDGDKTATAKHRSTETFKLVSLLRGDLDWIVMKCLEKDRKRRYETANGLALDVRRYLNDDPVEASPPSAGYRISKLVKRHKGSLAAAAAILIVLVAGLAASLWQTRSALMARTAESEQRNVAQLNEKKAKELANTLRHELYIASVSLAKQAWDNGDLKQAQTLLASQRPGPGETDLRGFEWRYLWKLCGKDDSRSLLENFTGVSVPWYESNLISFSADGSQLAIAEGENVSVWDFARRNKIATLNAKGTQVKALAFSPINSGLLAVVSGNVANNYHYENGSIQLWNLATAGASQSILPEVESIETIAFSPDGRKLAAGRLDGVVEMWDVESGTRDWSEPGHNAPNKEHATLCVTFSPYGDLLASGGTDTKIRLWNPTTGTQIGEPLAKHTEYVKALDFSPEGKLLASGGADSQVIVWDLTTMRARPPLLGHNGSVEAVDFSPDGETLVSASDDSTIRSWSLSTLEQTGILRGHTSSIHSIAFSPDGLSLVSCSERAAKLWDVPPHEREDELTDHSGWVENVVLSPDGRTLVSSDYHTLKLRVWDVPSRSWKGDLVGATNVTRAMSISADGRFLASGGNGCMVRLWDLNELAEVTHGQWRDYQGWGKITSDGEILGANVGNGFKFWDTSTGHEIQLIQGDANAIRKARFAETGHLLVTQNQDGEVSVWDTSEGIKVTSFDISTGNIDSENLRGISRDGYLIAIFEDRQRIVLYDVRQEKIIRRFPTGWIWWAIFSPDSKTLVTTSKDSSIKFWNVATGKNVLTLQRHLGEVTGVSFSADGTLMATSGADGTACLWPAASLAEADADMALTIPDPSQPEN